MSTHDRWTSCSQGALTFTREVAHLLREVSNKVVELDIREEAVVEDEDNVCACIYIQSRLRLVS